MVLCVQPKKNRVDVYKISDSKWSCTVLEEIVGLTSGCFSPCGLHVLVSSDFQLHLSVWCLNDPDAMQTLPGSKFGPQFNTDGSLMGLAIRKDCKDSIGIYCASTMKPLVHFAVGSTDLEEISFSPRGECIAVRDNSLTFLVLLYSTADGSLLGKYSAYQNALGARCMSWSPSGDYVAVGAFDGNAYILQVACFRPCLKASHVKGGGRMVDENFNNNSIDAKPSLKTVSDTIPSTSRGVSCVTWNCDESFFATLNESIANTVWIWSLSQLEPVKTLQFNWKVHSIKWSSEATLLSITTNEQSVFVWDPKQGDCCRRSRPIYTTDNPLPNALGFRWSCDQTICAVVGKTTGYLATFEENECI